MSQRQNFFWASYADLMTSLFFIMLVLYVLTFKILKQREEQYKVKAQQYDRMMQLEQSLKPLDDKKNFEYDKEFKRFTLKKQVNFIVGRNEIPASDGKALLEAGRKLEAVITAANKTKGVKYLVIIEGMASKDNYSLNNELSYARAKAVLDFWRQSGVRFNPDICELIVAGSGTGGIGRSKYEILNQRILVQVIPKVGK